jgi:hypothetical protein
MIPWVLPSLISKQLHPNEKRIHALFAFLWRLIWVTERLHPYSLRSEVCVQPGLVPGKMAWYQILAVYRFLTWNCKTFWGYVLPRHFITFASLY